MSTISGHPLSVIGLGTFPIGSKLKGVEASVQMLVPKADGENIIQYGLISTNGFTPFLVLREALGTMPYITLGSKTGKIGCV